MATFQFLAGEGTNINNLAGSGLGFYGSGFGQSVAVGSYPTRVFITSADGASKGPEADNVMWKPAASAILGQAGTPISNLAVPNERSTFEVRFVHTSVVRVESAKLYVYDRVSVANNPSGVTVKAIEIIKPDSNQANVNGSGDSTWQTIAGTGTYLVLANSPGASGLNAGNGVVSTHQSTVHSWFIGMSPQVNSTGSKTFSALITAEYF